MCAPVLPLLYLCTIDSDERTELDALRLENDTLRRHLGRLEDKVQRAEESANLQAYQVKQMAQQLGHGPTQQADVQQQQQQQRLSESAAPLEVRHLHGILQWLHVSCTNETKSRQAFISICCQWFAPVVWRYPR